MSDNAESVAPQTCILTGAEGENPDDCTTHEHEGTAETVARPTTDTDLDQHLRTMHGTLVYASKDLATEHEEQHRIAVEGRRDPLDLWTPHDHEPEHNDGTAS